MDQILKENVITITTRKDHLLKGKNYKFEFQDILVLNDKNKKLIN